MFSGVSPVAAWVEAAGESETYGTGSHDHFREPRRDRL